MTTASTWLILWTILIFASVAWYAALLFLVGWKGGKEILQLTRRLTAPKPPAGDPSEGTRNPE